MIFATVGTSEPFDRLLAALDDLATTEELVVQTGEGAARPRGATCVRFLEFDELVELVRRARVVVMHAGAGSVLTALAQGKRPLVVPRLARYGEAVDDHQLPFAERIAELGLVTLVPDPAELPRAIAAVDHGRVAGGDARAGLVADLRAYLVERLGAPAGAA